MNRDDLTRLYDDEYAASYETKWNLSFLCRDDCQHEIELIKQFLAGGGTWLDVECCNGFYLRHFPHIERAGIEISPSLLRVAREGNPGIPLLCHDFRDPLPAWEGRWDLVSCMWYGYGLVDSIDELLNLIHNLWSWTSPSGMCFVPLADPRLITGVNLPYEAPVHSAEPGRVIITGIQWSYIEDDGRKVHAHQLAPNLEFMVERFQVYFQDVQIIRYPPAFPGWQGRPALVARGKKIMAPPRLA